MRTRLAGLLIKEITQFLRDRVILFLILWLYTIEVVICAYALDLEIRDMPLATVDLDRTASSRALSENFLVTDVFTDAGLLTSQSQAGQWLQLGRARVALVIPEGFQRAIARGETATVQLLVDGTNSNLAAQARSYAIEIANRFHPPTASARTRRPPTVQPQIRIWYNPDQSYTPYVVLSMIALAAFMVGVIHPAASVVREKETGTIEQLRVTPVRSGEMFFVKTLPTLIIGVLSVFPSLLIVWWFDVPLRGSLALFLVFTAIFLVSAIGIGILVATVCRTLQQALLLSFFGLFPLMFLSGTVVPVESMPEVLQFLSLGSPLRHFMDVILGIFLKGVGFETLWPQAIYLAVIALPLFLAALIIFRRSSA